MIPDLGLLHHAPVLLPEQRGVQHDQESLGQMEGQEQHWLRPRLGQKLDCNAGNELTVASTDPWVLPLKAMMINKENRIVESLVFCTLEKSDAKYTPLYCRVCLELVMMLARDPRTDTRPSPPSPRWQTTGGGRRRPRCSRQMSLAAPTAIRARRETETETGDHVTVLWCPNQTLCSKSAAAAAILRAPREGRDCPDLDIKYDENILWMPRLELKLRTGENILKSFISSNVVDQGKMKKFYVR